MSSFDCNKSMRLFLRCGMHHRHCIINRGHDQRFMFVCEVLLAKQTEVTLGVSSLFVTAQ